MTATADRREQTSPDTDSNTSTNPTAETASVRWRLPAALFAAAVAFIVVGVIFLVRWGSVDTGDTDNQALIDKPATNEVIGEVSTALNQVLGYDYAKPTASQAAASKYLVGDAVKQYRFLLDQLVVASKGQKLTTVAKVSTAGVTSLHGSRAQLLVFVDQRSTRASDGKVAISAARVQIGAQRTGGTWKINEIRSI